MTDSIRVSGKLTVFASFEPVNLCIIALGVCGSFVSHLWCHWSEPFIPSGSVPTVFHLALRSAAYEHSSDSISS
jgi:hypothetical protein